MRIAHVIRSVNPAHGGTTAAVRASVAALAAKGHDVAVLSLDRSGDPWVPDFPGQLLALGETQGQYGFSRRLVPALSVLRADAVFVHGLWLYPGLATRLSGVHPYFVYPHGMMDPWFRDAYPAKHQKKLWYWRLAERRVVNGAEAVVFTSADERDRARDVFPGYAPRAERLIPLGIPPPPFDLDSAAEAFFRANPRLAGKRLLLFMARMHRKKGADLLLKAFAGFADRWELVMAGPQDDPAYDAELRGLASGLPVHFLGMLDGEVKWGALAACEAFVLPSHQENFGVAPVEALACGKPLLLSNQVNIWREIVGDGAAIAEPDTDEGTCRLLERAASSDLPAMGAAAAACFESRYRAEKCAQAILELVKEVR